MGLHQKYMNGIKTNAELIEELQERQKVIKKNQLEIKKKQNTLYAVIVFLCITIIGCGAILLAT